MSLQSKVEGVGNVVSQLHNIRPLRFNTYSPMILSGSESQSKAKASKEAFEGLENDNVEGITRNTNRLFI